MGIDANDVSVPGHDRVASAVLRSKDEYTSVGVTNRNSVVPNSLRLQNVTFACVGFHVPGELG